MCLIGVRTQFRWDGFARKDMFLSKVNFYWNPNKLSETHTNQIRSEIRKIISIQIILSKKIISVQIAGCTCMMTIFRFN